MIVLCRPYEIDIRQMRGIVIIAVILSFSCNYFAFEILETGEFNSFQTSVADNLETIYLICTANVIKVILYCLLVFF